MKFIVSLNSGGPARDVAITTGLTTTAGDLARELAVRGGDPLADLVRAGQVFPTLLAEYPGSSEHYLLDPVAPLATAGLRSGCTVSITPATEWSGGILLYEPVAVARVTSGPLQGAEFPLTVGSNAIGRDRGCRVRLADPSVSRRHAVLEIPRTGTMRVVDTESTNGVAIDGRLHREAEIAFGTVIVVGSVELLIDRVPRELRISSGPVGPQILFDRSPRVELAAAQVTFSLPSPPQRPQPQRFPLLSMVAPLAMGGVLYAVTQSLLSIVFVALSPLLMLGNWVDHLVSGRSKRRKQAEAFARELQTLDARATEARALEVATRADEIAASPDVAAAVLQFSDAVWARRPELRSFLTVRLGLGAAPSRVNLVLPSRGDCEPEDWDRLERFAADNRLVDPVPIVEDLAVCGNLGVAGQGEPASATLRGLVLQLTGQHSPAELALVAFGAPALAAEWTWLKWLPHVTSPHSPVRVGGLVETAPQAAALVDDLERILEERSGGAAPVDRGDGDTRSAIGRSRPPLPAIVVVVLDDTVADRARLVSLAERGPDAGIHLLWLATTTRRLPAACRTFIDATTTEATVHLVRERRIQPLVTEGLDRAAAVTAAMALAPLVDAGAPISDASDMPAVLSYQDLNGALRIDSADAVRTAWQATGRGDENRGLGALVGVGALGAVALDLREHGPHALVGGTTGAGKSEFLQTWIMSMAATYSPERVTFLLVDYKGGTAFAECTALPHTVGLVTDLTPALVRRALTSLGAEITRREHLLNERGAKDLIALERAGDESAPPALIIVIDEFAALASDVPEFVDGVIDVAQRGRSLGLHLVMATQRPAGVIKDNLRANTNLRIALRLADEADARDVVGAPDAAQISATTPGRAVAKIGHGRLLPFQTAYLGAPVRSTSTEIEIEIADARFASGEPWPAIAETGPRRSDASAPKEIQVLAAAITAAARDSGLPDPRRPWLPPLPAIVDVERLDPAPGLPLGLADRPEQQRQDTYAFRPDEHGSLLVLGRSGSGKTTVLRTLATAAAQRTLEGDPTHVYAIDATAGGLAPLAALPHVGAVAPLADEELLRRMLRRLTTEIEERSTRFAQATASTLDEYRRLSGDTGLPRILVFLDGFAAFREGREFRLGDPVFPLLTRILGNGRAVGVHVVATADRGGAVPTTLQTAFGQTIVLQLVSATDYALAGIDGDRLADAPAGRAVVGGLDVQLAVTGGSDVVGAQEARLAAISAQLGDLPGGVAEGIPTLPQRIALSDLPAAVSGRPTIGLSEAEIAPIGIPTSGVLPVLGGPGSGRTTAIRTILAALRRKDPALEVTVLSPHDELEATVPGSTAVLGASASDDRARELAADLPAGRVILVDRAADFEGGLAEAGIAALLKAARRSKALVIVDCDPATLAGAWQIAAEVKTARAALYLRPDESDGFGLFRVTFPGAHRAAAPVGRGWLIENGDVAQLQVAVPE